MPQMRTTPVGVSVSAQTEVMPYEQAEELVRTRERFAVSNCICRQKRRIQGKGCDRPEESCLSFDVAAEHGVRTGRARAISQEEALAILHRAEEVGLVLQPANDQNPIFICTCCGSCCDVLRNLKSHPKPASLVTSSFVASHNADTCAGCGTCTERCQMEAIRLDDGKALLNPDRCIGCGLCVSTCPSHSLSLVRKPAEDRRSVPKTSVETYVKMAHARGKLGMGTLIGIEVKSKVDRLLAPR